MRVRRITLEGRVALVTGASSGVGWQTAVRLAEAGVRVCVTARRRSALELLCAEIVERGGECLVAPGDVTSHEDVAGVVAQCIERYGHIDILVNGAAVQAYDWAERQSWTEIQRILDVTFLGQVRFARAVIPHFRARGSGHLLFVGSMLARGAAPLLSAYGAAKHALHGWVKALALELTGSGIDVSIVQLPSVSTPMFDHAPTHLGRAPRPVPPTYDTDLAARAIVRCARRPRAEYVPVWLQGRLLLVVDRWAPWIGRSIMGRVGARLQTRDEPARRDSGNLFAPVFRGVGPYGSVPPTPRWKRALASAALVTAASLAAVGARRAMAR